MQAHETFLKAGKALMDAANKAAATRASAPQARGGGQGTDNGGSTEGSGDGGDVVVSICEVAEDCFAKAAAISSRVPGSQTAPGWGGPTSPVAENVEPVSLESNSCFAFDLMISRARCAVALNTAKGTPQECTIAVTNLLGNANTIALELCFLRGKEVLPYQMAHQVAQLQFDWARVWANLDPRVAESWLKQAMQSIKSAAASLHGNSDWEAVLQLPEGHPLALVGCQLQMSPCSACLW